MNDDFDSNYQKGKGTHNPYRVRLHRKVPKKNTLCTKRSVVQNDQTTVCMLYSQLANVHI